MSAPRALGQERRFVGIQRILMEAVGACCSEIDLQEKVWTVPGDRMKAGREHRVPLSTGAMAALAEAANLRTGPAPDTPVFPGAKPGKPLSNMALLMLLRRMQRGDLTAHGFRSTFRDWCGESTNHPREVAAQALAHTFVRQGGSGLSARRSDGEAAAAHGGLGGVLCPFRAGWGGCSNAGGWGVTP